MQGLTRKGNKELLRGLDPRSSPPRAEAKDLTSQQRSILRRAMHDKTIVSKIIGMLKEDEEKNKKEADEEARLKALTTQRVRGRQGARKGTKAQGPQKEKQEEKVQKSRDGGSREDRSRSKARKDTVQAARTEPVTGSRR